MTAFARRSTRFALCIAAASLLAACGKQDAPAASQAAASAPARVLVVGTDFTGPSPATELDLNARLAVNLGAPVLTVLSARGKDAGSVAAGAREARAVLGAAGCTRVAEEGRLLRAGGELRG